MITLMSGSVMLVKTDSRLENANAAECEKTLMNAIELNNPANIVIDAGNLEYVSSAGLRVILKVKKKVDKTQIVNVSNSVYEVLGMTGFTEIMDVKKALRQISVDDCRVLGKGSRGTTYKLDNDRIIKVFNEKVAFESITREKENSKAAFISGIPTAIPFDTVRAGNLYGNVYEMINARPLSEVIISDPYNVEDYAQKCADLMKTMAETHVQPGKLRSYADIAVEDLDRMDDYIPGEKLFTANEKELLKRLYNTVPKRDTFIHGDFHTQNIFVQDDELILIDMAEACTGHPLFEVSDMYLNFIMIAEKSDERSKQLIGLDNNRARFFLNKVWKLYFNGFDQEDIQALRLLIDLFGHLRMMMTAVRSGSLEEFSPEVRRKHLFGMKGGLQSRFFDDPEKMVAAVARIAPKF